MEKSTIDFINISLQIKHICLRHLTLNVIWGILDCYLHFVDIVRCVNFTNIVVSCSSHSIYVRTQYYKVWYMNTNILSNWNRHVSFKLSEERETRCTRLFFQSRDVYIVSKKSWTQWIKIFFFYIISFIYCWFHSLFIQELYTFLVSMPTWIYILQLTHRYNYTSYIHLFWQNLNTNINIIRGWDSL